MATYTFTGDLRIPMQEDFGPITNSRSVNLLHPDMCQSDVDLGRTRVGQRQVDRSTWLPDVIKANKVLKDRMTLNASGTLVARSQYKADGVTIDQEAVHIDTNAIKGDYLKDRYGSISSGTATKAYSDHPLFWTIT